MALIYSDIKRHFNMPEMTLSGLMEILIVTGKKKARWGFSYGVDLEQVYNGSVFVYPDYIRAIQGHRNVDARWLDTRELTEAITGEVYRVTDLKNIPASKDRESGLGGLPPSVKWCIFPLAILCMVPEKTGQAHS